MIGRRVFLLLLFTSFSTHPLKIPIVRNVSLIPISSTKITTLLNHTCDECLCSAYQDGSAAFNCFLHNHTCQLFNPVPRTYRLRAMPEACLYFPQGVLPKESECCMPDLQQLRTRLANATRISVNVTQPRCLAIDDQGYLVTVQRDTSILLRFHSTNLSLVDQKSFSGSSFDSIAHHQETYYIGRKDNTVLMVNSHNLSEINRIDPSGIDAIRDMIFLHGGQTLVLASSTSQSLLFFNRTDTSTNCYVQSSRITTPYSTPHGLWYANDSFFYATSWNDKTIYSYSMNQNLSWTETLFIDAGSIMSEGAGSHVTMDDCQRIWFSMYSPTILIFDQQGRWIGNFSTGLKKIFDAILMDNYVMYLSDYEGGTIVRLDPNITC